MLHESCQFLDDHIEATSRNTAVNKELHIDDGSSTGSIFVEKGKGCE